MVWLLSSVINHCVSAFALDTILTRSSLNLKFAARPTPKKAITNGTPNEKLQQNGLNRASPPLSAPVKCNSPACLQRRPSVQGSSVPDSDLPLLNFILLMTSHHTALRQFERAWGWVVLRLLESAVLLPSTTTRCSLLALALIETTGR